MQKFYNEAARDLLTDAGLDEMADDIVKVELLADDIYEVAKEDAFTVAQAALELERRIGGIGNLKSYMDTLLAGAEK